MKTSAILLFIFLAQTVSQTVLAREWLKLSTENTVCGNGQRYEALFSPGSSDRFVIEFMAGGACFSEETCTQARHLRAWIKPIPLLPAYTWATSQSKDNPFKEDSILFFPYCTADVHSGKSQVTYSEDVAISHNGFNNIQEIQSRYFKNNQNLKFYNQLVVMGESAGAIGSFVHAKSFEKFFPKLSKKILISDSPGLHFGQNFWNKFPSKLIEDYNESFSKAFLFLDFKTGHVAPSMGPVFESLADWKIGILQSTEDLVMSKVFGEISPQEHSQLVLGPAGIEKIAADYPHVFTWIPETKMHTFLILPKTRHIKNSEGQSAQDFVLQLLK